MPAIPRTKDRFALSLQELLDKKSIQDISVGDIVENAGLSSRTFYNYFRDKNELLSYIYRTTVEPFWFEGGRKNSLYGFFAQCAKYAQDSTNLRAFGNALDYHGQNDLCSEIEDKGVEDLIRLLRWNDYPGEFDETLRETLHFFMCGISRVLELRYQKFKRLESDGLFTFWTDCIPAKLAKYLLMDPAGNETENGQEQ